MSKKKHKKAPARPQSHATPDALSPDEKRAAWLLAAQTMPGTVDEKIARWNRGIEEIEQIVEGVAEPQDAHQVHALAKEAWKTLQARAEPLQVLEWALEMHPETHEVRRQGVERINGAMARLHEIVAAAMERHTQAANDVARMLPQFCAVLEQGLETARGLPERGAALRPLFRELEAAAAPCLAYTTAMESHLPRELTQRFSKLYSKIVRLAASGKAPTAFSA